MTRAQTRIPVLATKATAFWITGDTGLKPTAEIGWENTFINAEEQAAIVYIPDNVVADADYDLWDEYRPEVEEALAVLSDDTVLFGAGKPATLPGGDRGRGHRRGQRDPVRHLHGGLAGRPLQRDEQGGGGRLHARPHHLQDGHQGADAHHPRLARRASCSPPTAPAGGSAGTMQAGGADLQRAPVHRRAGPHRAGARRPAGEPATIVLDEDAFVIGRRKELAWKSTDTGVITDGTGAIVINLFQQDASALRVTTRWGWQVRNPVNRLQPVKASRYPAGVLTVKVGGGFGQLMADPEARGALEGGSRPALSETAAGGAGATTTTPRERARTNG